MRAMMTTALIALLAAGPAGAQEHHDPQQAGQQPGHTGQMGMQGVMGMMGSMGMHGGPDMVLRMAKPLGLTDAQVERLQGIRDAAREAMQQHMQQAMQAGKAAGELLGGASPDLDAYQARLREAADHGVLADVAMARATVQVRQILTPEQRGMLETGMRMMQHMMQGGSGMMTQGAMQQGTMQCMMMDMMRSGGMGSVTPDTTPR